MRLKTLCAYGWQKTQLLYQTHIRPKRFEGGDNFCSFFEIIEGGTSIMLSRRFCIIPLFAGGALRLAESLCTKCTHYRKRIHIIAPVNYFAVFNSNDGTKPVEVGFAFRWNFAVHCILKYYNIRLR